MGKATRTPAREKVRLHLIQAISEKWSASKLAKVAGVSRGVATSELKAASGKTEQKLDAILSDQQNELVGIAESTRRKQARQAQRYEDLHDKALVALEAKAEKGELSVKDLEAITRLREKHWHHLKDIAGIELAEKVILNREKGTAEGVALGNRLIDATAIELGDKVRLIKEPDPVDVEWQ